MNNFQNHLSDALAPLPHPFVSLNTIDPTIHISLRYASHDNFVGKPLIGYNSSTKVFLTKKAAQALQRVQQEVQKDGYSLVIYDGYRPQQTVDYFIEWSKDLTDQQHKALYYPYVDKERVFEMGYVACRSGHSRGSTVDVTLIKNNKKLHPIIVSHRTLLDGRTIPFLDDGTVDMGSSFDLFDVASHYENKVIPECYKPLRSYLRTVMEKHGFKGYAEEWWHFVLKNEPFPDTYFNFPVE